MKLDLNGRLLFLSSLLCFTQLSIVESFNWTVKTDNPTLVTKGEDKSLIWEFTLTAEEQTKNNLLYFMKWHKFNQSSSDYSLVGGKSYFKSFGSIAYDEPMAPHITIDRNHQATLHINNVRREDEGTYKIEYSVELDGTLLAYQEFNVTVSEPPEIVNVTGDQYVCVGSMVNLSCNATGKPVPNITWTRVWENGTDSGEVSSMAGFYVISNTSRSSNGTYRCTASNGVGTPANQTTEVIVEYSSSVDNIVKSSNAAIEGHPYNLSCEVSGDPVPSVSWIKVSNNENRVGKIFNFTNISRNDTGSYTCEASNRCGNDSKTESINVLYKPDDVTLERNTTENNGCTDMWVNFTCISSEANPPVHNYVLLRNEKVVGLGEKGTWIEKISRGETFVYKCRAYQQVDNVTSTNNISLSVKVPAALEQIKKVTVEEDRDVIKECNETAGTPPLNFSWKYVKTGQVTKGKLLTLFKIRRNQSGEYRCIANNTCGNESTGMFIDVHYKPDNVTLERNTTGNNGCTDMWVNFTCISSEANPPVHNYVLLRNEKVVGLSEKGTWIEKISRGETFVYKCRAYQQVDNVTSTNNISLSVKVPAALEQIKKVTVEEDRDVIKECNETAGTPPLNFSWKYVKTGQVTKGKLLTLFKIRRNQSGEYRCIANNTCGNESTTMFINVEYPPSITHIIHDRIVNETDVVQLNCTGDGNPLPTINWTHLPDNITVSKVLNITGKQDEGLYRCTAENGIGNAATKDVNITVRYYRPLNTLLQTNTSNNSVIMDETFSITCTTEANPPAKYVIYRDETTIVGNNSVVTSSVAGRVKRVTFTCKPSNYYGVGQMAHVSLEVFYHPYITNEGPHVHQVQEGRRTSYPCPIDGNPPPDFKWYSGNGTSLLINSGKNLSISETLSKNSGWYTCQATNKLGDKIIHLYLIVAEKPTPSSVSPTMPRSEDVYLSMTSNASCEQLEEGEKKIPKAACDLVKHHGCSSWELLDGKCGSIIVEFKLEFNQSVVASEVMTTLQEAAKRGTVGGFQINSIKQISPQPATPTEEQSCDKPFHRKNCEIHWTMVGILIGCSLVFVVVVAVIIGYYVQKRRNCRHPTKVHDSSPDVQPLSSNQGTPSDGNIYAGENGGYAKSGPLPTVDMVTEQQLGAVGGEAIPTYSTVDKSKKKDKKKDKKAAEQKEMENQYAAVDKTKKKKKKNEVDDTYAEVDMSKKSKKNPKAGEVLYADLGEFHAMQKMPEVSTSPKPLPPIKMPEAYGETQYADITQFLKEKPGDTGAEPPKESTTSAVRDTATGSKEESPAGNVGDGAEAINETGF